MGCVERCQSGFRQHLCSGKDAVGKANGDRSPLGPARDLGPPIDERMLRVFEIQNGRPGQAVAAISDSLEDFKDRGGFPGDPGLVLVIEWPVETVQVEIE